MSRFLSHLQYSSCSEDSATEIHGLDLNESDQVVSVTGSGGRTFDLLIRKPLSIVSVDINPWQTSIARLKSLAMRSLDHKEFLVWVGLDGENHQREDCWGRIRREFPKECDDLSPYIQTLRAKKRLLYSGRTENHWRFYSKVLKLLFGSKMDELLQATSIEEQRKRWGRIKESVVWRCALWLGSHPFVFRFALDNWGWYRQSLSSDEITSVVGSKFDHFMSRHLIRNSHLAQLILQGAYTNRDALPLYLRKDYYPIIQSQIERVKFLTVDLQAYLDQLEKKPLLKLSGSNVPAYLDANHQASLWKALSHRLGVGSRVCFRGFLSPLQIDDEWKAVSETMDASELQDSDKSLIYDVYLAKKVS